MSTNFSTGSHPLSVRTGSLIAVLLSVQGVGAQIQPELKPPLSLVEILDRMGRAEVLHSSQLEHYSSLRTYRIHNDRFNKSAEMTVDLTYRSPGRKHFRVVAQSGANLLCQRVLRPIVESEVAASGDDERRLSKMTQDNYVFTLIRCDVDRGRPVYVLGATPKSHSKYLMKGEVWVDATDFGVSRIIGHPAKSVSFWVRESHFVYEYSKFDNFWLPLTMESEADSRFFGRTEVKVSYETYQINLEPRAQAKLRRQNP